MAGPRAFSRLAALAAAAALSACAAGSERTGPAPDATALAAAPAAPPPPMFLEGPYDRVPTKGKAILVNIPSYELIAFEDGQEVLRSRVIVGTAKDRTPELVVETSVVRFRPTWKPTDDMVREEGISPDRRPAGKKNPLGLMAIRLDPGLLIYLHGTNQPKLFAREKRALSHGCIRVEKVEELAAFVLDTTVDEVQAHANGRRTFDMEAYGIPVLIRYHTRFPDANGVMQEYADVYGRDPVYAGDYPAVGALWPTPTMKAEGPAVEAPL
jgi:murein L,D-transpeptidase YcbB/YkuD